MTADIAIVLAIRRGGGVVRTILDELPLQRDESRAAKPCELVPTLIWSHKAASTATQHLPCQFVTEEGIAYTHFGTCERIRRDTNGRQLGHQSGHYLHKFSICGQMGQMDSLETWRALK